MHLPIDVTCRTARYSIRDEKKTPNKTCAFSNSRLDIARLALVSLTRDERL